MALVNYSDSEASDTEPPPAVPPKVAATAKPKLINCTESKKIKVELPQIRPEPGATGAQEPPSKRARTAGAFSGFNSLLPAPKKTGQNAPKPGVSLKTSSEAAFSRTPVPVLADSGDNEFGQEKVSVGGEKREDTPKTTGKPTRFMPLSVANAKKKKPKAPLKAPPAENKDTGSMAAGNRLLGQDLAPENAIAKPKAKVSLFSFGGEDIAPSEKPSGEYQPEFTDSTLPSVAEETTAQAQLAPDLASTNPNTLSGIASDLDLTPAQRRQLFGRHGRDAGNIAHFNMDAEYRSNQEMAASGETFEHRAVKAIAPGKHSLQQLVNNVKSQSDALEDKWAEGRRNRGDGGSKYGF